MEIRSARTYVAATALLTILLTDSASAGVASCPGDCDLDGQVEISELIRGVRIALGELEVSECGVFDADADGSVTVSELVAAVRAALGACVADTPTPGGTPTATPLPRDCGDAVADGLEECDDGNGANGDGCSATCQLEPGGDPCAGVATSAATRYRLDEVASGLSNPLFLTAPPLDPHRVFIVEQAGRIMVIDGTEAEPEPTVFLDLTDRVRFLPGFDERGLLSVAFHPDYENNGWFFVNYNCRDDSCPPGAADSSTVISRFERSDDPNVGDAGSERVLITIPQPFSNHNGGLNAFGPDGYLYVGMGDGGLFDDPLEAGQDDGTLLGKMLRIDVDVAESPYWRVPVGNPNGLSGELGLIWAKGLRNPWRFSFDRATGDLYIADVGQDTFEEISVQPGDSPGGENYGWDIFEGTACLADRAGPSECPQSDEGLVRPVLEYGRDQGVSITGGYVYRGCSLPALDGHYFYSDHDAGWIRTFVLSNGSATQEQDRTSSIATPPGARIRFVSSFGEDARGEIYLVERRGQVYKLVADE